MAEKAYEVNFEGIVGPTHNYSGLSYGNVASTTNENQESNPREAARQGLEKMKFLADMGVKQAVLPPHERPFIPVLRQVGFTGSDADVLARAFKEAPEILMAASSAAAMWTANAGTVTPSADSADQRVHFTPANLSTMFHRSMEPGTTEIFLKKIFSNSLFFTVHNALPSGTSLCDEGAANHCLLNKHAGALGVHLFVYGRYGFRKNLSSPEIYPARQTFEASAAVARAHKIFPKHAIFAQQTPRAIDAGAFHNDVVAVSNENLLFYHEDAFLAKNETLNKIREVLEEKCNASPKYIEVTANDVSLHAAIQTYLFNSQIVTIPDGSMVMIAPSECLTNYRVHKYLEDLIQSQDNPISQLHYLDLRQSMQNGGGPACLRLRVTLTEKELAAAHQPVFLTDKLYHKLDKWIDNHYRDRLSPRI